MTKIDSLEIRVFTDQVSRCNDLQQLQNSLIKHNIIHWLTEDKERQWVINFKKNIIKRRINDIIWQNSENSLTIWKKR